MNTKVMWRAVYVFEAALGLEPQTPWTREEDGSLHQLYSMYGSQWSRISRAIHNRTSQQCRSRWHQINGTAHGPNSAASQQQVRRHLII